MLPIQKHRNVRSIPGTEFGHMLEAARANMPRSKAKIICGAMNSKLADGTPHIRIIDVQLYARELRSYHYGAEVYAFLHMDYVLVAVWDVFMKEVKKVKVGRLF